MEQNVNAELLAACKKALECIARLTPFSLKGTQIELQTAVNQSADYADVIRDQLRKAIEHAERETV